MWDAVVTAMQLGAGQALAPGLVLLGGAGAAALLAAALWGLHGAVPAADGGPAGSAPAAAEPGAPPDDVAAVIALALSLAAAERAAGLSASAPPGTGETSGFWRAAGRLNAGRRPTR